MQVRIKLIGSLRDKMPPGGTLELPEDATIEDVLALLDIPEQRVQVVSVNSRFEHDRSRLLAAADEVTILPTVIGG